MKKKQKVEFKVTLISSAEKVNKRDVINEVSQLLASSTHGEFKVAAARATTKAKK